jgi:hypothetical protein
MKKHPAGTSSAFGSGGTSMTALDFPVQPRRAGVPEQAALASTRTPWFPVRSPPTRWQREVRRRRRKTGLRGALGPVG